MSVNKVLIAGSGAIGLRTALECLRSNLRVVLMSATHPLHPSTCSMGSGGLWMPFRCDDMRVVEWSKETLSELLTLANDGSIQNGSSVEIVPTLVLKTTNAVEGRDLNQNSLPKWTSDHRLKFQHMTLEMLNWQNLVHQLRIPPIEILQEAGYPYCWHFHAPIVNGPNMLQRMLDEISSHDRVEHIELDMGNNKFKSIEDMVSSAKHHGCDAVINCTGVGSMSICKDNDLHGARGIIHQYDRSSASRLYEGRYDAAILTDEGSWGNETEPCYMIPRGNKVLIGGSYLPMNYDDKISANEHERLTTNAQRLGIDTTKSTKISEWIGFRPARSSVRLEIDENVNYFKVIHNYGHGGSGWTVFVGAAKDAVRLLFHT